MPKQTNIAEEYVKIVNENLFLKEFTYAKNEINPNGTDEIELADNIVWLDEYFFLIQIKWRNPNDENSNSTEEKWFNNKIIKKAKNQIKETLNYFHKYPKLEIVNNAGFKANLSNAPLSKAKNIIIYLPDEKLSDKQRQIKFYKSNDVGLIHIFHFEDYRWICQYLITICEINWYLNFREEMRNVFGNLIDTIPEQLILGKYLSGKIITSIDFDYMKYVIEFEEDVDEFDFLPYLNDFRAKTFKQENESDYISIIKEITKLTRFELKEFKLRFQLSIKRSNTTEYTIPYRMTVPRLNCGFLFIPIDMTNQRFRDNWTDVLKTLTFDHKYDQKLEKCVGVIIFRYPETSQFIEIYWLKVESLWEYDEFMDEELKKNFPFRKVNNHLTGGYKFKV